MIPCSLDTGTQNWTGLLVTSSLWQQARIPFLVGLWNSPKFLNIATPITRWSSPIVFDGLTAHNLISKTKARLIRSPLLLGQNPHFAICWVNQPSCFLIKCQKNTLWIQILLVGIHSNPQSCFFFVFTFEVAKNPHVFFLGAFFTQPFLDRSEGGWPVGTGYASQLGEWDVYHLSTGNLT